MCLMEFIWRSLCFFISIWLRVWRYLTDKSWFFMQFLYKKLSFLSRFFSKITFFFLSAYKDFHFLYFFTKEKYVIFDLLCILYIKRKYLFFFYLFRTVFPSQFKFHFYHASSAFLPPCRFYWQKCSLFQLC